ncbi:hypothetical protein EMIT0P218_40093 [Pseudomonas sp. IT-P218]
MWLCGSSKENTDLRRSNVNHDQAGHHVPLWELACRVAASQRKRCSSQH